MTKDNLMQKNYLKLMLNLTGLSFEAVVKLQKIKSVG